MTPVLETARLWLRPLRESDLDDLMMYVSNPDVALWTTKIPHPYTEQDGRDWMAFALRATTEGTENTFVIEDKATRRLMGAVAFRVFRDANSCGLGYWIGAPYWNKGFMTEACARIVRYAFEELELAKVTVTARPDNIRSIRVQEKLGLRYVGERVEDAPARGAPMKMAVRELERQEWRKLR